MTDSLLKVDGLSEKLSDYEHNYNIIVSAVKLCKKNNLKGIRLPKGIFAVYNKKALDLKKLLLTAEISAVDYDYWHNEHNVLFDVTDFDSFCVLGNNTKLLLDGLIGCFNFENVNGVQIENVSIDWINPLYFTGVVTDIKEHKVTVKSDTPLNGGEPIVSFQNFDCATGIQKGMSAFCDISNVCRETGGKISFESADVVGLTVGDCIIARYIYGFAPLIHFYRSKNIYVKNVAVYASCGMGVIAHNCKNIEFEEYKVMLSDGRKMSTLTDATHFISCEGKIDFKNCVFEGMGDDAVNVHGFYIDIKQIIDERTVLGKIEAAVQDGNSDIPEVGDLIEFCDMKTLLPFASGEIAEIKGDKTDYEMVIVFKEELPNGISANCYMANTSKTAKLSVADCTVKNIRGRAMLIQTRNAVIKNNVFENCTGQAVHIDTAVGWRESIGTRNIEVAGNKFINCGYGITKYCDAVGVVIETEAEKPAVGVHKNIIIRDNYIKGNNVGIKACCVENLKLENNTFVDCKSKYELSYCKKVEIS